MDWFPSRHCAVVNSRVAGNDPWGAPAPVRPGTKTTLVEATPFSVRQCPAVTMTSPAGEATLLALHS